MIGKLLLLMLVLSAEVTFFSGRCIAQVTGDTSVNNIAKDSTDQKLIDGPGNPIDKTKGSADTQVKPYVFSPNPKKAGLYSAIMPGLGQLYNRQYWKIPVVYAGLVVAGYAISGNLTKYQAYRRAYIGRINNANPTDPYIGIYDSAQLKQLQNDYSKYLDMSILFSSLGYLLHIVDAITAAHLHNFDISRDISMKMSPLVLPNGVGMGLVMNF